MRFHELAAIATLVVLATAHGAVAAPLSARPGSVDLSATSQQHRLLAPARNAQTLCRLGQYGDPVGTIGDEVNGGTIFFGEGDTYWTYLDLNSAECPGCSTSTRGVLTTAHIALYFPFAPETVTVKVSVVGTVPVSCHYPNYLDPGDILCAPFIATLDGQDSQTVVDFAIPIPPGCQIYTAPNNDGTGFLGFEFVAASDTTTFHKPLLAVQAAARICTSFNPIGLTAYDMVLEYQVGNPVMYAEVEQCYALLDVGSRIPAPAALKLGAPAPNPSFGRVLFTVSQAREAELDVSVYDVRGANVRPLYSGLAPAGDRAIEWDGRDQFGRMAPAGVYYVRAYSGSSTATQRVLRMR